MPARCEAARELGGLTGERRGLPALRVAEEELDRVGADRLGLRLAGHRHADAHRSESSAERIGQPADGRRPGLAESAVGDAEAHADERGHDPGHDEDPLLPGRRHQLGHHADARTRPCRRPSPRGGR